MAEGNTYSREKEKKNRLLLFELKKSLPRSTYDYLDDKAANNPNTALAYAHDLITFYEYILEFNPECKGLEMKDISDDILEKLTYQDINEYQAYLSIKHPEITGSNEHNCHNPGIARRMSALRGYFEYQCEHGYMSNNPTVGSIKIDSRSDKHAIIRLTSSEVNTLLNLVKSGDVGSEHQNKILLNTKYRDYAILFLLLNTGIRVSECVGLDISDINFNENSMRVFRKGQKEQYLYFNEDVLEALTDYIELERVKYLTSDKEPALFLSTQKKRMSTRAIQSMVSKYASIAISNKRITPHKMRSTYGTALYNQTGDIRLVADVLGHNDINTTAKHYADIEDKHRRIAATIKPYDE